jgi:hypothetical protein
METLVLDPLDVSLGRTEFDITPYVAAAGPDWGEAAIEQYLADEQLGQLPVDYRLPNRTIAVPLLLRDNGAQTFESLRASFQQKVGLFQREGGWVKRQTALGPLFADVVGAQLKFGGSTAQALWGIDADAVLTLTTLPEWYGEETGTISRSNAADATDLIYILAGSSQSSQFNQSLLNSAPSLYWRLGAVNGLVDQSGQARNGTAAGGLVVGGVNGALTEDTDTATAFPNINPYVTSTYSPFVTGSLRSFAGLAWHDGGAVTIFGSNGATAVGLSIGTPTNDVSLTLDAGANQTTWPKAWPGQNQWVHWALIVNDLAKTAELFINGVSQGVLPNTKTYSSPGTLKLSGSGAGAIGGFIGQMDEFAVWERALTPAEISMFANQSVGWRVAGDLSARARLLLTDLSTTDLHGLLWGVRCRHYSNAPTAALAYEADVLTPIAPAAVVANANASGGNEVKINTLSSNWTAILSTDVVGIGSLTHTGSYRVWARVRTEVDPLYPAYAVTPRVRFVWDVGDLMGPVENTPVRLPLDTDFWLADLGEVRLDPAPIGTHRWQGVIQAAESFKGFAVDKLWFQPLDEAAGRLSIAPGAAVGLTGYTARDAFDSLTTGAVTGQALSVGGNWTYSHGDTDDFTYDGTNYRAKRVSVADTAARFIYAPTPTLAATAAQIDFYLPTPTGPAGAEGVQQAYLMFRRVDASNYGYAVVGNYNGLTTGSWRLYLNVMVAGVPTTLAVAYVPRYQDSWWSLRVVVSANGYIFAWLFPQGATVPLNPIALRYDPTRFGTGGPFASGKVGFGDQHSGPNADARYYDNFLAWVPDTDAVVFAGRSAELRFDGMYREAPGGGSYAQVGTVLGDLLRIPPAGMEARTTEIFLKPSFGDLGQASDSKLLRLQAQMRYRPSYLFVPEG